MPKRPPISLPRKPNQPSGRRKPAAAPPVSPIAAKGLYIVATPIGNARDITLRALDTLAAVDAIACEDTRVTAKLLALYGIATPMLRYHDHNARSMLPKLIERLKSGQSVALVSDAGTPLISDPGFRLVRTCRDADIPVTALPGASAVTTALAVGGIAPDRFCFAGFAPAKAGPRRTWLSEVLDESETVVVFESARRLSATLADIAAVDPEREIAVCRELTKRFEEVRQGRAAELAAAYGRQPPPKGELVLVIARAEAGCDIGDDAIDKALARALAGASLRDAVQEVARSYGIARKRVYARALAVAEAPE